MTLRPTSQARPWYFEDFEVGQLFTSHGRTITESDVVTFAGWSWDANPVHTDAETQLSSRFGQRIAHGALGLSVALGLASRIGVFDHAAIALLGVAEWRFAAPIFIGDTVHVEVVIQGMRRTTLGDAGVLQRLFRLVNQDDVLVQVGRLDLLMGVRPSEA